MAGKASTIRLIRTWHRRLALVLGLFLVFQGLTGAISQYRFYLLGASDSAYAVSASGIAASPGEVLEIVERDLPGFSAAHVMYPATNAPDTAVMVMGGTDPAERMARMVTLDQYRGNVIEDRALRESAGFIGLASTLHKWTIFGTSGRIILTLVGLGATALASLGLLLWWRTRKARPQSLVTSLHRKAGLVVAALLLPIAVSGTTLNLVTWFEQDAGLLVTSRNMREAMSLPEPVNLRVSVDDAYAAAIAEIGSQHLAAFSPASGHARHHWFAFTNAQLYRTDVLVNAQSGAIEGVYPSGLVEGGGGIRGWLFPLHSLHVIGPIGGALATIMGLSLSFWFVSGIITWRRGVRTGKAKP